MLRWIIAGAWLLAIGYWGFEIYREDRHARIRDAELRDFTVAEAAQSAIETHRRNRPDPLPTTSLETLAHQLELSGLLGHAEVMHLIENPTRFRLGFVNDTPTITPLWLIQSRALKSAQPQ